MFLRTFAVLILLALSLAGCGTPDESIPPALAELYQRAAGGDAAAQLELGMRYVTGKGIAPNEQAALRSGTAPGFWAGLRFKEGAWNPVKVGALARLPWRSNRMPDYLSMIHSQSNPGATGFSSAPQHAHTLTGCDGRQGRQRLNAR